MMFLNKRPRDFGNVTKFSIRTTGGSPENLLAPRSRKLRLHRLMVRRLHELLETELGPRAEAAVRKLLEGINTPTRAEHARLLRRLADDDPIFQLYMEELSGLEAL